MKVPPHASATVTGPVQKAAATSDVTITAVVTAVGTALAAFQLFQPKFAIRQAMRRETGHVERGYFWLYDFPQGVMVAGVAVVWSLLFVAVLHQLIPSFAATWPLLQKILPLLELQNLIPLLLLLAVLAGVIQLNVLSRIALFVTSGVAFLPFGRLSGAFGKAGRSAGWLQAKCICATWDKGQPLLIAREEVERVGDELLLKLSTSSYRGANFAPKPAKASTAASGNIALFGCLIESAHASNRWTKPKSWTDFYAALAEVHNETNIFEPDALVAWASGQDFSQYLRDALAAKMLAKGESIPDANYYGAAAYVARAWSLLKATKGSVLRILPFYAGVLGTKLYWLDRKLAQFPLFQGDGMRPQMIKLMTRWDVTPWVKEEEFLHPFSKTQAWLLLEEGVLRTLPEQKDVTFWAPGDVGICNVACRLIFEHVRKAAGEKLSHQASAVTKRFPEAWDLYAAADYTLWDWAQGEFGAARAAHWKGYHWKLDDGRASKTT